MTNGLGIDFNPEPAYGSNSFEPVQQGINLGLGLQREQRAGQEFEMQKRLQEEERKIREVERRNKSFQEGIGLLKDKKFLAGFPTELKNEVIRKKIAPYLTQDLGLPMDDSVTFKDVEPIMNEAINVFESSAPDDMKRQALMKLMARADPEERKDIREIAEFGLKKRGGIAKQVPGKVTDTGLPLFFDSDLRQFGFNDPSSGEFMPYFGQQFPAQANPSSGSETELREIKRQRSLGSKVLKLMTPDKVGVIDKKFKTIGNYFENSTDIEAEQFKTFVSIADTIARNNFYGATLTDNEQAAFQDIAYNRNLSPSAFIARVRTVVSAQDELEEALRSAASAANRPFRDQNSKRKPASDNSDLVNMSDEELQAIIAGQK